MYLSRWQQLLDGTLIAPASADGPLRRGRDVRTLLPPGKRATGAAGAGVLGDREGEGEEPVPPDVGSVIKALGEGFRGLVGGLVDAKGVDGVEDKGQEG